LRCCRRNHRHLPPSRSQSSMRELFQPRSSVRTRWPHPAPRCASFFIFLITGDVSDKSAGFKKGAARRSRNDKTHSCDQDAHNQDGYTHVSVLAMWRAIG
jgi:homogentisate 1,2-dioxygenase